MVDFVVDKSLNVLLDQLNRHAPNRSKASDGSIGDPAHAARVSAHNPQDTADSSDGNDPDDQVDARDFTHDPANGADMNEMTEDIRASRDRRVRLVIWNRRQFSSYSTDSRKAWEWGAYSGTNDHTKHAHVEVNDLFNDDLSPWKVFTMADSPQLTTTNWRIYGIAQMWETVNNHVNNEAEPLPIVKSIKKIEAQGAAIAELKEMLKVQGAQMLAMSRAVEVLGMKYDAVSATLVGDLGKLKDAVDAIATTIDLDDAVAVQRIVENGVRAVLKTGVDQA